MNGQSSGLGASVRGKSKRGAGSTQEAGVLPFKRSKTDDLASQSSSPSWTAVNKARPEIVLKSGPYSSGKPSSFPQELAGLQSRPTSTYAPLEALQTATSWNEYLDAKNPLSEPAATSRPPGDRRKRQARGASLPKTAAQRPVAANLKISKAGIRGENPKPIGHTENAQIWKNDGYRADSILNRNPRLNQILQKRNASGYDITQSSEITNTSADDGLDLVNDSVVSSSVTTVEALNDTEVVTGYTIYSTSPIVMTPNGRTPRPRKFAMNHQEPSPPPPLEQGPWSRDSEDIREGETRSVVLRPHQVEQGSSKKQVVSTDYTSETPELEDIPHDFLLALDDEQSAKSHKAPSGSHPTCPRMCATVVPFMLKTKASKPDRAVQVKNIVSLSDASPRPKDDDWALPDGIDETTLLEVSQQAENDLQNLEAGSSRFAVAAKVPKPCLGVGKCLNSSAKDQAIALFARPAFPKAVRDRSPIIGVSGHTFLRTCFRIGEALNAGCQAARCNQNVVIELYAKVDSSCRLPSSFQQQFVLSDLFHDRQPWIHGTYELWKSGDLWTFDSGCFLMPAAKKRMCRVLGRMKREKQEWKMTILNIWEATWEDIKYVKEIICS